MEDTNKISISIVTVNNKDYIIIIPNNNKNNNKNTKNANNDKTDNALERQKLLHLNDN